MAVAAAVAVAAVAAAVEPAEVVVEVVAAEEARAVGVADLAIQQVGQSPSGYATCGRQRCRIWC